ncbi:MAG TPA: TonB-dependent receptor [Bacteroidales bacterium]|nr:TonB-dependent receptor [Bacteroidales bacterium]
MKFSFLLLFIFLNGTPILSQVRTINGYIEDSSTGERLIGAIIYDSISQNGCNSNYYGYFTIKAKQNLIYLKCSFLGYDNRSISFTLKNDTILNIKMDPRTFTLNEVIVDDSKLELKSSMISFVNLPIITIKNIPSLMGETDVLKVLLMLPGVQSGTEGTVGLYIRGGSPDQNMILLDGIPIYNPDHLFGFVSVFNSDAIKNVTLIKGGFPAQYGGRLSSIVDVRMKEGNNKETHGEGSIGLISSKLMVEGPIIRGKSSYLLSARRSWIDLLTRSLLNKKNLPDLCFYDLTAKVNHIFSNSNRLYFSIYSGRDKIQSINTASETIMGDYKYNKRENQFYGWGNIAATLRWNHIFNNTLFSNSSLTYSNYRYFDNKLFYNTETNLKSMLTKNEDYKSEFHSGINDISIKSDFDYQPIRGHNIKFGIESIYHLFTPNAQVSLIKTTSDSSISTESNYRLKALEPSIYFEDDIELNSRLKFNTGLRFSGFLIENKSYYSIEPRLSGRYLLTDKWAVKFAYSRMKQYVHLLTSSRVTFPTDLWVPTTKKVKPQLSDQLTLGSVYNLNKNLEINIEAYYKTMNNVIEYSEGSSFMDNNNWESKIELNGKGKAYGVEVFFQKTSGKTTGWLGYTLARSVRKFDNISFGNWYPYKYDRRHQLSILINNKFAKNIDAGITWELNSGNMITLISQVYDPYGFTDNSFLRIQYFENRNNYRLPYYHKMDLGINFHKQRRHFYRTLSINIYNVYNRKNIFFVYFGNDDINGRKDLLVLKKYTLFPILPSLTYSLKF